MAAITPSMLCLGRKLEPLYAPLSRCHLKMETDVRTRWKHRETIANHFWAAWSKTYTTQLQQRRKWHTKKPNVKVGDIVVLERQPYKRNDWPLGRITQLFPAPDGTVRNVQVQTLTPNGKRSMVRRHVNTLFPLDCAPHELQSQQDEPSTPT